MVGRLPADWHLRTVTELDAPRSPQRLRRLDTTTILRAVGICFIVSTHMGLWFFPGGAHIMLAVVGYNLSRFQLSMADTGDRIHALLRTTWRIVTPVVAWVAVTMFLVGGYGIFTLLLVNNYLGPATHQNGRWHFWFVEVVVHLLLITILVLAIPVVRRTERRAPFLFALGVLLLCLVWRLMPLGAERNLRFQTHSVAFFFALGWLIHQSRAVRQRVLTTALCIVTIPGALGLGGYFADARREWFVALALIALTWIRAVPVPAVVLRLVAVVAAASLWILITHFKIWPPLARAVRPGVGLRAHDRGRCARLGDRRAALAAGPAVLAPPACRSATDGSPPPAHRWRSPARPFRVRPPPPEPTATSGLDVDIMFADPPQTRCGSSIRRAPASRSSSRGRARTRGAGRSRRRRPSPSPRARPDQMSLRRRPR